MVKIPAEKPWSFYDGSACYFLCQAREKFSALLEETEEWLYEDGENQSKKVYQDKLAELKVKTRDDLISSLKELRHDVLSCFWVVEN